MDEGRGAESFREWVRTHSENLLLSVNSTGDHNFGCLKFDPGNLVRLRASVTDKHTHVNQIVIIWFKI